MWSAELKEYLAKDLGEACVGAIEASQSRPPATTVVRYNRASSLPFSIALSLLETEVKSKVFIFRFSESVGVHLTIQLPFSCLLQTLWRTTEFLKRF
jgi:hypothetical protein